MGVSTSDVRFCRRPVLYNHTVKGSKAAQAFIVHVIRHAEYSQSSTILLLTVLCEFINRRTVERQQGRKLAATSGTRKCVGPTGSSAKLDQLRRAEGTAKKLKQGRPCLNARHRLAHNVVWHFVLQPVVHAATLPRRPDSLIFPSRHIPRTHSQPPPPS